jgi:glycosyltransferase involved in cell wall biosynthesis
LKKWGFHKTRIFIELHEAQHYVSSLDPYINGYIVVSEPLRAFLLQVGIAPSRILLAPNGVDLESYEEVHRYEKHELRRELGLPQNHPVICYTGQLGPGRNVEMLIAALKHLDQEILLVLVGGNRQQDLQRIQAFVVSEKLTERVILRGHEPAPITWRFQMAADVLAIPYASYLATAEWCSPLKLAEYLATGIPIVAFPLPSLQSVLHQEDVVWATEETALGLAEAIAVAMKRQRRRLEDIRSRLAGWTWVDRAQRIAAFMGIGNSQ